MSPKVLLKTRKKWIAGAVLSSLYIFATIGFIRDKLTLCVNIKSNAITVINKCEKNSSDSTKHHIRREGDARSLLAFSIEVRRDKRVGCFRGMWRRKK